LLSMISEIEMVGVTVSACEENATMPACAEVA
jgi:hypothetical protein